MHFKFVLYRVLKKLFGFNLKELFVFEFSCAIPYMIRKYLLRSKEKSTPFSQLDPFLVLFVKQRQPDGSLEINDYTSFKR